jgi:DMSO reductase anchor subunit
MIYACLKTVPQWNTFITPAAYLALGAASGGVLLTLAAAVARAPVEPFAEPAVVLLAVAATLKFAYYEHARRVSGRVTLAGALGQTAAQVRLLDAGHSHRTFLTDEFVFRLAREHGLALRIVSLAAGCAAPLAIVAASRGGPGPLGLAAALCVAGVAVERWLFFAEAQHVVRLYHGQPRV